MTKVFQEFVIEYKLTVVELACGLAPNQEEVKTLGCSTISLVGQELHKAIINVALDL